MKHSIAHVALVVRDYDEAIAFHTGALGSTLVEDTGRPEPGKRWVVVAPAGSDPGTGGAGLLLARAATPEQARVVGAQAGAVRDRRRVRGPVRRPLGPRGVHGPGVTGV